MDQRSATGRFAGLRGAFQSLAVAALAGFLSGTVALGVGCRLAMRAVALLAGDADQGRITDAQAVVGEITLDGTIFLTLLGGAIGTVGGLLHLAVRRHLAWAGPWRGIAFGGLLLAVFGSALIENRNPDFERFGIPIVNVVMFGALFVLFGILVAPVHDGLRKAILGGSPESTAFLPRLAALAAGTLLLLPAAAVLLGTVASIGDEDSVKRLTLVVLFAYLLVSLQLPFLARAVGAPADAQERTAIQSMAPFAPPIVAGLALNIYELSGIL